MYTRSWIHSERLKVLTAHLISMVRLAHLGVLSLIALSVEQIGCGRPNK